jgi:hypothetical protein
LTLKALAGVIVFIIVSILGAVYAYFKGWLTGWFPQLIKTPHKLAKPEQEVPVPVPAKPEQGVPVSVPQEIKPPLQQCDMPQKDVFRIIKDLEEMPPLLVDDVTKTYIGLTVDWLTEYLSASKINDSLIEVRLLLILQERLIWPTNVMCEVDLSKYKQFSILKKGAKIRVNGTIVRFAMGYVKLSNVKLYILNDA